MLPHQVATGNSPNHPNLYRFLGSFTGKVSTDILARENGVPALDPVS